MIKGYKLKPFKKKITDRVHHQLFGSVSSELFPLTLNREAKVFDDFGSSECVGYGIACAASYRYGVDMSGDYQEAKTFQIMGVKDTLMGADPRAGFLSGCIFGHLPQSVAPFSLPSQNEQYVTNFLNWDQSNDTTAEQHIDPDFVLVTPSDTLDQFDAIKSALIDGEASREVVNVWTAWYSEWNETQMGIVPTSYGASVNDHFYTIFDFCTIDNIEYLKALPAQGIGYGNAGVLYFPREVINKEVAMPNMGAGMVKDVSELPQFAYFDNCIDNLLERLALYFHAT